MRDVKSTLSGIQTSAQIAESNSESLNPGRSNKTPKNNYQDKTKKPNGLAQKLNATLAENQRLRSERADRREKTPTVGVTNDSIQLQYEGKVAGKRTVRTVDVLRGEQVQYIAPLVAPIVHLMNAALREHDIENHVEATYKGSQGNAQKILGDDGRPMYKPDWMIKAHYAYDCILTNPQICDHLKAISQELEKVMKEEHFIPFGSLSTNIPQRVASNAQIGSLKSYLAEHPDEDGQVQEDDGLELD